MAKKKQPAEKRAIVRLDGLAFLDWERWHERTGAAMRRIRTRSADDAIRYAKMLDLVVEMSVFDLSLDDPAIQSRWEKLGLDGNRSRAAATLERFVGEAERLSRTSPRARIRCAQNRITVELERRAKAIVLLELHPGRCSGVNFTRQLIDALRDYYSAFADPAAEERSARDGPDKSLEGAVEFTVEHGGVLASGPYHAYVVLSGSDFCELYYHFVRRVVEPLNDGLKIHGASFKVNAIPTMPHVEFDMDYIRATGGPTYLARARGHYRDANHTGSQCAICNELGEDVKRSTSHAGRSSRTS